MITSVRIVLGLVLSVLLPAGCVQLFGIGHSTAMLLGVVWVLMLLILFIATMFAISQLVAMPDKRTKLSVLIVASATTVCIGAFLYFLRLSQ
jgi:hypothetical protein